MSITINVEKARGITHDIRRITREEAFKPYDEIIVKQIPGFEAAEAERVKIREKYAVLQTQIDAAPGLIELKALVDQMRS